MNTDVLPPPPGLIYHGVFPGGRTGEEDDITLDDLISYEQAAGKPAAWVYFSNNWYRSRAFPLETASWIRDAGAVPFIRLMLRSGAEQYADEPTFTLDRINSGEFDDDLRAWSQGAMDYGTPLLAEYGTEVNGEWFQWNAAHNGRDEGAARFRDAYRRIVRISREEGADNVLWVFHANSEDVPYEPWNRMEEYYPGDDWVDWLGLSAYGAQTPSDEEASSFGELAGPAIERLARLAPDKPIAVLEFGVTSGSARVDQASWARAALEDLTSGRWPEVVGFSWWNEAWQNDDDPANDTNMKVQDNPALIEVFRELVGENARVEGYARTGEVQQR